MNKNLLGIDFEDWFHPELIKKYIKDEKLEPKVVDGIEKILELLRKMKHTQLSLLLEIYWNYDLKS